MRWRPSGLFARTLDARALHDGRVDTLWMNPLRQAHPRQEEDKK